jgi:hypothetical protein
LGGCLLGEGVNVLDWEEVFISIERNKINWYLKMHFWAIIDYESVKVLTYFLVSKEWQMTKKKSKKVEDDLFEVKKSKSTQQTPTVPKNRTPTRI